MESVNIKQLDRMVQKIARLESVYEPFCVWERTPLVATLCERGTERPIAEGDTWGADFEYGMFKVKLPDIVEENFALECDTGAVEHLIFADGKVLDMTDWVRGAATPSERLHRYVSLDHVSGGAVLTIEGYASHTFYGTMPYETKQTFSLATHREHCVYRAINLVKIDLNLKRFIENLQFLNSLFRAGSFRFTHTLYEVYGALFDTLSRLPERPDAESVAQANTIVERFFASICVEKSAPHIGLIGHSHLDTAWLWSVEETRHKAVRTAACAARLMEKYPDYKFIMSSVVHLDWIRQDVPDLFERLVALHRKGQFEPNGAAWVECDCNLTGGEAMVRQFLRGQSFLRKYFGYTADAFWLPDTFGYSAALPQIMQGVDVKYFLTTKLSWNDTNVFPYDAFRWQGLDGSEVTAHFNTTHCYANPETVAARTDRMLNKHLSDRALIAYGYGDGGGGPDETMVRMAQQTQAYYPCAAVHHTTVSDFMQNIAKDKLPTYAGELYLELHRGTLTMHHDLKRLNRKLEIALRNEEFIAVANGDMQHKEDTDRKWDTLLLNQFHDILPGTCIARVNDIAKAELKRALDESDTYLSGAENVYTNTLSFARAETLDAADGEQRYIDFDGKEHSLARFAFAPFGEGVRIGGATECHFTVDGNRVTTPFGTAVFEDGRIVSYVCFGRETVKGRLNDLRIGEDMPMLWDNWDIDADATQKERAVTCIAFETISVGVHEARFRCTYRVGAQSELVTDVVFDAYSPRINFSNRLNWQEDHTLLRTYFETDLFAPRFKSETQFGFLERMTTENTSVEQAQFEVCQHKWSDLSETHFGVAILNDCKYGFGCRHGRMHLTLAKGGTHPDERGDHGIKYFHYAYLPHQGGFSAGTVTQPAYAYNIPPVTVKASMPPIVSLDGDGVMVESMKFAERGGIVVRLYECERSRCQVRLQLARAYSVSICNLLEDVTENLGEHDSIALTFRPFEIKTILLQ